MATATTRSTANPAVANSSVTANMSAAGATTNNSVSFSVAEFEATSRGSIEETVLDLALDAASCAVRSGKVNNPRTLTVIDYSRPSSQKRMWVYDLKTKNLLYEE